MKGLRALGCRKAGLRVWGLGDEGFRFGKPSHSMAWSSGPRIPASLENRLEGQDRSLSFTVGRGVGFAG